MEAGMEDLCLKCTHCNFLNFCLKWSVSKILLLCCSSCVAPEVERRDSVEDGAGEGVEDVGGYEGGGRQERPRLGRSPRNRKRQFNTMTLLATEALSLRIPNCCFIKIWNINNAGWRCHVIVHTTGLWSVVNQQKSCQMISRILQSTDMWKADAHMNEWKLTTIWINMNARLNEGYDVSTLSAVKSNGNFYLLKI